MNVLSTSLKKRRKERGLSLANVAIATGIDKAIINKIENNKRQATKKQVLTFIEYYKMNEQETLTAWLSDKIIYTIQDEDFSLDALQIAEESARYLVNNSPQNLENDLQNLLDEIDMLQKEWSKYKPLDGIQMEKMKEYYAVKYTYDSNRIEGNTLTMQETFLVVKEGLTVSGKSMTEHLEAINHYEAIDFIVDIVKQKESFTERTLKEIHYLILKSIDKMNAGAYRNVPVFISGSAHLPPQPYLLARKMEEVFEFYRENKNKMHPVILAAEMHERIVSVHPFIDGNGRTSRLSMNLVLLMNGFTIANIQGDMDSRMAYYNALESVRTENSPSKLYKLIAYAVKESLELHIKALKPAEK